MHFGTGERVHLLRMLDRNQIVVGEVGVEFLKTEKNKGGQMRGRACVLCRAGDGTGSLNRIAVDPQSEERRSESS